MSSILARIFGPRSLSVLQSGGKDALTGFHFARCSSVAPILRKYNKWNDYEPKGRKSGFGVIGSAIAFGFAYKVFSEDRVLCSGKKNDNCENQCDNSKCLHNMDKEEEVISKANAELEKVLKDIKPKAMDATEIALKAYCEAVEIVKKFMDKAYCAIEQDGLNSPKFEETWCEVYDLALKRCEKVKDALHKGKCAWELLCRLREIIENGKNCKYTSCNPLLITAEEALLCAERELLNARAKFECVQSDSILVEQYRDLIVKFHRDVKNEMETMKCDDVCTFGDTECEKIIPYAYKKVLRVQKELALIQVGMGKVPSKQAQTLC